MRSLLALGTFLTLVSNPTSILLHFPTGMVPEEYCGGVLGLGAFCLWPTEPEFTRLLLAAFCIPVLVGFLPSVTGLLHWYAAFTLSSNTLGVEGGDQLTVNLSGLLCLASLADWRLWGWRSTPAVRERPLAKIWANTALLAARLQVAYVYFEAAIVKLANPLWSDGTAMWLWVQNAGFGASTPMSSVLQELLKSPWMAVTAAWGTIALEFFLCFVIAFALASQRPLRLIAFVVGVVFHLLIAVTMGLVSFGVVMTAALLVSLWRAPDGATLPWPRRRSRDSPRAAMPTQHSKTMDGAPL